MRKWIGALSILLGVACLLGAIGFAVFNRWEAESAAQTTQTLLEDFQQVISKAPADSPIGSILPGKDFTEDVKAEMATVKVDGYDCFGILSIPVLELELPVLADWSYEKLKIAPCVYSGSIYQNNMVIAAHNYWSHFSQIKNLKVGDAVIFTDCDDNVFEYTVGWVDILQKYDTEEMKSADDWDLTMFTCTYGGKERYTVRCIKEN